MTRRIPLWLTLLPLVAAIAAYWLFWTGWARDFEAALQPWLPGTELVVTGFPYRLETALADPDIRLGDAVKITASASTAQVNRGPWQPQLTVISAESPRFSAMVSPVLSVNIVGKTALTSVKVENGLLTRLSSVIEAATVRMGASAMAIAADSLELHLRERPVPPGTTATTPTSAAPTGLPRGQLVIAGERLRIDGGAPLTVAADVTATGAARLLGYDAWAGTGTLELTSLTLADAHGTVASARATLAPVGRQQLRIAGTVETICPASIAAALQGLSPPAEKRLRAPVRLSFEGVAGDLQVGGMPADIASRPTRGQLPPCPVVRAGV